MTKRTRGFSSIPLLKLILGLCLGLGLVVMLAWLWSTWDPTVPDIGSPLKPGFDQVVQEEFSNNRSKELLVFLGFSGGGTRAAALSYGVLQELAETNISTSAGERRLLDEIDVISSVSGGSFTNAYFGLFGDGIFKDFREKMLLRPIQSDLLKAIANPVNWSDLLSPYYGRSDLAVEYYNEHIFEGKTFSDIDHHKAPWIIINASDIGTGDRLVFTTRLLNLLCLDYDSYPVARAVAASSGVPGAGTPIVMKNYAGSCGHTLPDWFLKKLRSSKNPMMAVRIQSYLDYLDADKRPWLHLVDGGITDNLGLRQFYEFSKVDSETARFFNKHSLDEVKDILIITVNAAVQHYPEWANTWGNPKEGEALGAMTYIQMRNYTADTIHIVRQAYRHWQETHAGIEVPKGFELVEVTFSNVQDDEERAYLNKLPTSLELSEEQVDKLIAAGRHLLRESPDFQEFLARYKP
jgi:NTE family protein